MKKISWIVNCLTESFNITTETLKYFNHYIVTTNMEYNTYISKMAKYLPSKENVKKYVATGLVGIALAGALTISGCKTTGTNQPSMYNEGGGAGGGGGGAGGNG